jgi:hypothetical protein
LTGSSKVPEASSNDSKVVPGTSSIQDFHKKDLFTFQEAFFTFQEAFFTFQEAFFFFQTTLITFSSQLSVDNFTKFTLDF